MRDYLWGFFMRRIIIAVAAIAILAVQAAPAAAFDWNGFYAGVGFGYSSTEGDVAYDLNYAPMAFETAPEGWFGGVAAGFNASVAGGIVLGIEADLGLANITDTVVDVLVPTETVTSTTDWTGSLRGRLGFDAGEFMPYVTGGIVAAHVDVSSTGPGGVQEDAILTGAIVGAGVEVAVTDSITLKGEYLYRNFGDHTWFEGETYQNTSTTSSHSIRGGINFHF